MSFETQLLPATGTLSKSRSFIYPESIRAGVRLQVDSLGRTSMLTSVCLLVQSIVGGGLLAYPHAYAVGGVANMIVLQGLLLVFIAVGLWVLAWCTEATRADTYQAMVKCLLGRRAEIICEVSLVTLIFGAAVVYLDVCIDSVYPWILNAEVNCRSLPEQPICGPLFGVLRIQNRSVTTGVVALILSSLCLGRSMASLSLPSLCGFAALIYVCFVIIGSYMAGVDEDASVVRFGSRDHSGPVWWRTGVRDWLSMIPVIVFSYQGHISAVPLYAELKGRSMTRWLVVISVGLGACVLLYNATGLLGYFQFLEKTNPDVLVSLVTNQKALNIQEKWVMAARGAVALAVSVTFAVFTHCARSAILNELANWYGEPNSVPSQTRFLAVTYAWVIAVAIAAICVPDMWIVVSVVGNVSTFFMFQFPGLCLIASAQDGIFESCGSVPLRNLFQLSSLPPARRRQAMVGWLFLIFGTFVFVLGLSNALYSLI
mmetsp:Transcript_99085/g.212267  ORF Transcript_99085/g.212267 Transcript_99085/m.212267 type:complete len:485 (+) Transcript_99085:74-1528(+)